MDMNLTGIALELQGDNIGWLIFAYFWNARILAFPIRCNLEQIVKFISNNICGFYETLGTTLNAMEKKPRRMHKTLVYNSATESCIGNCC